MKARRRNYKAAATHKIRRAAVERKAAIGSLKCKNGLYCWLLAQIIFFHYDIAALEFSAGPQRRVSHFQEETALARDQFPDQKTFEMLSHLLDLYQMSLVPAS